MLNSLHIQEKGNKSVVKGLKLASTQQKFNCPDSPQNALCNALYEKNALYNELAKGGNFTLAANANFYSLSTSSIASAVHIPTPLYDRNPELLRKIEWSQIDEVYRTHREETRDLAFQLFCSESGYMRFFPAASWFWDNHIEHLDLFDCRNTQWYINAATNSKNVIIMLDMSGSMLGQRYEIAKQTTEAILETLSHNDYFNIMPFSKTSYFLDDCNGKNGLLQATMRNKKLPGHYELHTREEMALMEPNSTEDRIHCRVIPEHVLSADPEYIEAVSGGSDIKVAR
ncbi:VWA protein [Cooperia oncophora]